MASTSSIRLSLADKIREPRYFLRGTPPIELSLPADQTQNWTTESGCELERIESDPGSERIERVEYEFRCTVQRVTTDYVRIEVQDLGSASRADLQIELKGEDDEDLHLVVDDLRYDRGESSRNAFHKSLREPASFDVRVVNVAKPGGGVAKAPVSLEHHAHGGSGLGGDRALGGLPEVR